MHSETNSSATDIRPSPLAGRWYPADADVLRASIENYLSSGAAQSVPGKVLGLIVPHAGHLYSGKTAALAFKLLRGLRPATVAVISPSHHYNPGHLLTSDHQAYSTPLGTIALDTEHVQMLDTLLQDNYQLPLTRLRSDAEHSTEIELPFLQTVLEEPFALLPVMMMSQDVETAHALGRCLAETLRSEPAILVASTDLSHFYPRDTALRYDTEMLSRMEAFDPQGVILAEEEGFGFACGRGAAAAVMWACRDLGADTVQVLGYSTSGDVTGDYDSVVGYGSAVIYQHVA